LLLYGLPGELGSPPPERGIALGLFSLDPDFSYRPLLEEIRALGATDVSITWVWWQADLRAGEIQRVDGWSATDAQVAAAMSDARALGLRVTALPIVRLMKSSKDEWRGRIEPADEDAWWRSYRAFILRAALLSDHAGAQRLSVGSELVSREGMRSRWSDLIDEIRCEAPSLELMYSANWDHYREVSFWDRVDVVGITGYFELTRRREPSVEELVRGWSAIKSALRAFSDRIGRRLVLTEIGYPSLEGGAARPWDETRRAPVDLEQQRSAYEAAARAWSDQRFLAGIYWWNWFGFGGASDPSYTPRGKPAEKVIESWYRAGDRERPGPPAIVRSKRAHDGLRRAEGPG
jgi:hypothetical protein